MCFDAEAKTKIAFGDFVKNRSIDCGYLGKLSKALSSIGPIRRSQTELSHHTMEVCELTASTEGSTHLSTLKILS